MPSGPATKLWPQVVTAHLLGGFATPALLSTGEDRAKAMIEWSWAGFAHERPGRITVRTEDD
mgnify:CR=1 FL=1